MQVNGTYRIAAAPQAVWDALFDPDVLRRCIPGCEDVQRVSPTQFTADVVLKIGPVKARFTGKMTLSELDEPRACRLTGEGSGGAAGFAKGGAAVTITPDGDGSVLNYTADAQIGGRLAQLGSRMVEGTTRKLADEFFSRFSDAVGRTPEQAEAPATGKARAGQGWSGWLVAAAAGLAVAGAATWLLVR
ncbi:MAG: carbon monoxide dehydrogenase subunit G [Bradyrhizobiaceae bacterium]|nr:carbon monoxide dehydrogenase subunit G [Bradyrhizobiaceae bacterium]